jgi:predicted ribosome-associated RNA-binding protein Tma20
MDDSDASKPVCRPDRIQVILVNGVPLFFAQRDDIWFPTLRLLHQYPDMMPKLRADTGAIKFVLSGANIMCPGLTSAGATIHDEVFCRLSYLSTGQPLPAFLQCREICHATFICC